MDLNFSAMVEEHRKDTILENAQAALDKFFSYVELRDREDTLQQKIDELHKQIEDHADNLVRFAEAGVHDIGVVQAAYQDGTLTSGHLEVLKTAFESLNEDSVDLEDLHSDLKVLYAELADVKVRRTELTPKKSIV